GVLDNLRWLAWDTQFSGDWSTAVRQWREIESEAAREGMMFYRLEAHFGLGQAELARGNLAAAVHQLEAASRLAEEMPPRTVGRVAAALGKALARSGDTVGACAQLQVAETAVRAESNNDAAAWVYWLLADLHLELGEAERAVACCRHVLSGPKWGARYVAPSLVEALEKLGEHSASAKLIGSLLAGPPLREVLRQRVQAALSRLRTVMPEEELEAALALGSSRTLHEVIAEHTRWEVEPTRCETPTDLPAR
ncbi:MAG TPA: hypothetical protein VNT60_01015, partial [Deinococcales bacterium]|nr:hypothetical protein [Deinococcales bacterium]